MAKWDRIEKLLEGRVSDTGFGNYYRAVIPVDAVIGRNTACIRRNMSAWREERIVSTGNRNFFVPLKDLVVVDIESTGISPADPIFLNGIAWYDSKKDVFKYEGFFARDFYEEDAILHALKNRADRFKWIFSFNGAFDLSRLSSRLQNLQVEWRWPRDRHFDLLHALAPFKKKQGLDNARLTTYEVALLGYRRPEDDVAGEEIPKAYNRYRKGGDPEPLVRIVRHNALDVFSTAAFYVKLLRNPEYLNQSLLEKLSFENS